MHVRARVGSGMGTSSPMSGEQRAHINIDTRAGRPVVIDTQPAVQRRTVSATERHPNRNHVARAGNVWQGLLGLIADLNVFHLGEVEPVVSQVRKRVRQKFSLSIRCTPDVWVGLMTSAWSASLRSVILFTTIPWVTATMTPRIAVSSVCSAFDRLVLRMPTVPPMATSAASTLTTPWGVLNASVMTLMFMCAPFRNYWTCAAPRAGR